MGDGAPISTTIAVWVDGYEQFACAEFQQYFSVFQDTRVGNTVRLYHYGETFPVEIADMVKSVSFFAPSLTRILQMYLQIRHNENIKYYEGAVWNGRTNEDLILRLEDEHFNGGVIRFYDRNYFRSPITPAYMFAGWIDKVYWVDRRKAWWKAKYWEEKPKRDEEEDRRLAMKRQNGVDPTKDAEKVTEKRDEEMTSEEKKRAVMPPPARPSAVLLWVYGSDDFRMPGVLESFHEYEGRMIGRTMRFLRIGESLPIEVAYVVKSVTFFAPGLNEIESMHNSLKKRFRNIRFYEGAVWNAREAEHRIAKLERQFNGGIITFLDREDYTTPQKAAEAYAKHLKLYWEERRSEEWQMRRKKWIEETLQRESTKRSLPEPQKMEATKKALPETAKMEALKRSLPESDHGSELQNDEDQKPTPTVARKRAQADREEAPVLKQMKTTFTDLEEKPPVGKEIKAEENRILSDREDESEAEKRKEIDEYVSAIRRLTEVLDSLNRY